MGKQYYKEQTTLKTNFRQFLLAVGRFMQRLWSKFALACLCADRWEKDDSKNAGLFKKRFFGIAIAIDSCR